jgi:phospholipase C
MGAFGGSYLNLADILDHIRNSPLWARTAVIVTYDENGGFWARVAAEG